MGSFLVSCFVSHQSIPEDSPCVLLPIFKVQGFHQCQLVRGEEIREQVDEFHSTCYPDAFWKPLGFKLNTTMKDGGDQVLSDTNFNRISLGLFFKKLLGTAYVTAAGKNQYHELAFDLTEILKREAPTLAEILSKRTLEISELQKVLWSEFTRAWNPVCLLILKNRVFIRDYKGRPVQVQFAVCLKSAYDYIVRNSEESFTSKIFNENLSRIAEEQQLFLKSNSPQDKYMFSTRIFRLETGGCLHQAYYELYFGFLGKIDWARQEVTREVGIRLRAAMVPIFNFMQFQSGLTDLNIRFQPMTYVGQDYDNSVGRAYAKMVAALVKDTRRVIRRKYE